MLQKNLLNSSWFMCLLLYLFIFNNSVKANLPPIDNEPKITVSTSSLFFSTTQNISSITQQFSVTVSNVSAGSATQIIIPKFYDAGGIGSAGGTIVLSGNATMIIKIFFAANAVSGNYADSIVVKNDEFKLRTKINLNTENLKPALPVTDPTKLVGFTAVQGGAISPAQSFDLTINKLPTQGDPFVTVTAPKGYSVGFTPNSFVGAFILFAKNGSINSKVFVSIKNDSDTGVVNGKVSITGAQIKTKNVTINGKVSAKSQPIISVDKSSLSGFVTTTFKASATQSYSLTASNLISGQSAVIKAPTGYEISLTANGIFSSQSTISQNTGNINQQVFVRLKSQSVPGNITGVITNTVGALSANVNVSGNVLPSPTMSVNPTSLSGFSTKQSLPSAVKTYTFIASNLALGDKGTVTAPPNYELREQGQPTFASSITLSQKTAGVINTIIEVRIKAGAITGTVSGFIQNSIDGISKTVSVTGFVSVGFNTNSNVDDKTPVTIKIFPNPFKNNFSVEMYTAYSHEIIIKLSDRQGNVLLTKKLISKAGTQIININAASLINGFYLLNVIDNNTYTFYELIKN